MAANTKKISNIKKTAADNAEAKDVIVEENTAEEEVKTNVKKKRKLKDKDLIH